MNAMTVLYRLLCDGIEQSVHLTEEAADLRAKQIAAACDIETERFDVRLGWLS